MVWACHEAEHTILIKDYASYNATEHAAAKFIHDPVDKIWYHDLYHA